MFEYIRRVWPLAFRGFAVRADLTYFFVSLAVSGLTGSRQKPLGDLTTYDLSRWVLMAFCLYALFRLLILAPYRLWQEQCLEIGQLKDELSLPARHGSEAMHRIRAEKRIELAAKLHEFHWAATQDPKDGAHYYNDLASLAGQTNVPPDFKWLIARIVELTRTQVYTDKMRSFELVAVLSGFLHGDFNEVHLRRLRLECEEANK